MLQELHVRDLALIEEVWLEFGPGMTVLTGETGAGKTALLGALRLLLGDRADSGAVRSGASEALVEGRFSAGSEEMVAKRRVSADGRSRCQLNGEMSTVGALGSTLGPLVDLHSQHEHQALLVPSTHVGYLDRWSGEAVLDELLAFREARAAYRTALAHQRALEAQLAEADRNSDYLRFVAEEIDRVGPVAGEDEQLEARLPALQHAERLIDAATRAGEALRGEGGAMDRVAEAAAALARVAGIDPALDAVTERLAEVEALVDDTGTAARAYRDSVEHDPAALDEAMARLAALSGLKKKYGPTLAEVFATRERAGEALAVAGDAQEAQARAALDVERTAARLREAAERLEGARRSAAPGFSAALNEAAAELAMQGATFDVAFTEVPFETWGDDGPHRVEFMYAPAPRQPARPLAKIASGGELSRVMLALRGVLGEADSVQTLVFDEVDAGIGGSVAHAVGRRLAELARTRQVIVVTHLAQVAAYADEHLVVRKEVGADSAATIAASVRGEERVAEVARMLGGSDSQASRAHARELLGNAEERAAG